MAYYKENSKKTVWILEGFLVYFTEERVQEILRFISENSPENSIIMVNRGRGKGRGKGKGSKK